MSYERCVACNSTRLSPIATARNAPTAYFKLKDPPKKGWVTVDWEEVALDRVCVCADCGFAAFFAQKRFDPDAFLPG